MSKVFLYLLFAYLPKDSSQMAIYNDSNRRYYLLIPRDRKILLCSDYPSDKSTYIKFNYYKRNIRQEKIEFNQTKIYDTIFIDSHSFKYVSFLSQKRDLSDSIPLQHIFEAQIISKNIGVIKKDSRSYYALKSNKNFLFDYRRLIHKIQTL
jgi:hypothetical protein